MLTLLLANWRLIAGGAVVAAFALMGWRVTAWHQSYRELPKVQAALQAEVKCESGSKCQERQQILEKRSSDEQEKIRKEYKEALDDIANRPPLPGPVRLCRPASKRNVPNASPTTGTSPNGGGELQVEVGEDIAKELAELVDDADGEAAKLRALWGRDVALATRPTGEKVAEPR